MIEFQVIVLAAGKGSRITELTSRKPKCLLPIGNNPMVYYPLKMLERCGFKDAFLVVLETAKSEVEFALEKTDLSIDINVVTIPSDIDTDWGTADSLRYLAPYIISDFIVISCDLLTSVNVKSILNFHRKNDASLTALYFEPYSDKDATLVTPGSKSKDRPEKDLVGIDPVTNRLVFLASASDFEEQLPLKRGLLRKHGSVRIFTNLTDAHFFVMKKWLIKYLTYEKNLSTIKGELIPYVLKKQLSPENKRPISYETPAEITPVKDPNEKKQIDLFSLARDSEYDFLARSMSSYNDHCGDLHPVYFNDSIKCYGYVVKEFGVRTNTLRDYCKANRVVSGNWNEFVGNDMKNISPESVIESTQFDRDNCFVGPCTKISAKTSITSSTFGSSCVVESKTRVSDSVIMNNVVIKEGCAINNCVICDDVVIEENCTLKDCVIGSQYVVSAGESHSSEVLTEIGSLMEI